jgi:hypothetical protein
MPRHAIIITREEITGLATPSVEELSKRLGGGVKRRLSHIEPTSRLKRWFFHLLRQSFGDEGPVSDWTRRWKCRWQVNFAPSGGALFVCDDEGRQFCSRDDAVTFEERRSLHYLRNGNHSSPLKKTGRID